MVLNAFGFTSRQQREFICNSMKRKRRKDSVYTSQLAHNAINSRPKSNMGQHSNAPFIFPLRNCCSINFTKRITIFSCALLTWKAGAL